MLRVRVSRGSWTAQRLALSLLGAVDLEFDRAPLRQCGCRRHDYLTGPVLELGSVTIFVSKVEQIL